MDAPLSDRTLRRYLAGALDPGRREEVEAALAASRSLRDRLAALSASTVREEPSGWRLPPVGARGPWALTPALQQGAMMGEDEPGADDYVELRFSPPEGLGSRRLVVLERGVDGEWEVIFPAAPEEERAIDSLPREPDGRIRLDIVVGEGGRLAVALPPATLGVDWTKAPSERWDALREALERGEIPVETAALTRTSGRNQVS